MYWLIKLCYIQVVKVVKYWNSLTSCMHCCVYIFLRGGRAGGIGPDASVLAAPVLSQGKSKIPFLQKASNKQSSSVILGLIRLIILSYNRQKRHIKRCKIIGCPRIPFIIMLTRCSVVQKLSNKQNGVWFLNIYILGL